MPANRAVVEASSLEGDRETAERKENKTVEYTQAADIAPEPSLKTIQELKKSSFHKIAFKHFMGKMQFSFKMFFLNELQPKITF